MIHSVLINVPVSSPLHPQANLPFLKGFLAQSGFSAHAFDTNSRFFRWILRDEAPDVWNRDEYISNPIALLSFYNRIEAILADRAREYRGLSITLRSLKMCQNRIRFDGVREALDDRSTNPFIEFYSEFIAEKIIPLDPGLVGISVTFQDQIVAAFTLASLVRKHMPDTKIVLGGQMITRCWDSLIAKETLNSFWDYLALWDGELPLLDLHIKLFEDPLHEMYNVIESGGNIERIERSTHAFDLNTLGAPDFSDLNFEEYLFPDMLIPLQTARGCYGTCEFCAIPSGSNRGFRMRSPGKIIDDILAVQAHTEERYGKKARHFKFMDDTSAPDTLIRLSEEIERRGIHVTWETFVRLEKQFEDIEVARQLFRGGCRKLMWGLETNDPDILKNMNKKISSASTTKVLRAIDQAGILNFVFVLIGFPGETQEQRERLADYIIANPSIHVLTLATFDVTKKSPIHEHFAVPNRYGLEMAPAEDFEVRLPYTVNGKNWKHEMVIEAQRLLVKIISKRTDIGFMSLFPDQVRGMLCDLYGNTWGKKFLSQFGEENIQAMLLTTEQYADRFANAEEIDLAGLPEPIKREHDRVSEDLKAIADAIRRRKMYETRRIDQV